VTVVFVLFVSVHVLRYSLISSRNYIRFCLFSLFCVKSITSQFVFEIETHSGQFQHVSEFIHRHFFQRYSHTFAGNTPLHYACHFCRRPCAEIMCVCPTPNGCGSSQFASSFVAKVTQLSAAATLSRKLCLLLQHSHESSSAEYQWPAILGGA
jgi:hypothetical protein